MMRKCVRPVCCAAILLTLARAGFAAEMVQPPVVPGFFQLQRAARPDVAASGLLLIGELNCTACHRTDTPSPIDPKGAPDLSQAGARITSQYVRAFVSDPHGIKPGSTMPGLLHGLDAAARAEAVESLTHYLVSLGGPIARSVDEVALSDADRGRKLYHTIGCVACHAPEKTATTTVPSVPQGRLAMKTTIEHLADFLQDPLKVRPAGRMPNLQLTRPDARAIAAYLLREQFDNPQNKKEEGMRVAGLRFNYYAGRPANVKRKTLSALRPAATGTTDGFDLEATPHAAEDWAASFAGVISIAKEGDYTFYLNSDDGSCLYLDDAKAPLVDNDKQHGATAKSASIHLTRGDHPILVTFFQATSGYQLSVEWEGPDIQRQPIPHDVLFRLNARPLVPLETEPFVVNAEKAAAGKALFQTVGCAACHHLPSLKPSNAAKPLADLNLNAEGGCLSPHPSAKAARYDLSPEQVTAIGVALQDKARLSRRLEPAEQVTHALAAMNCYACHNREGLGGPPADRTDYFTMTSDADMGDEGRLPPKLTHVGEKLEPAAIKAIVFEGKMHIRPVLATRMPLFSAERLAYLPAALAAVDGPQPDASPAYSEAAAVEGRKLVGTRGLGCVNCHGVAEVKSLGMPAPNLSLEAGRLRPGWFRKLLENPPLVNPGTRMPAFWDHGQVAFNDIAGGTMIGQIDAIWDYLSQGGKMALPLGLQRSGGYELIPSDMPIVHRTAIAPGLFSTKIGARAILVGNPELLHYAFDAGAVRLAFAWRGRFFDAGGQWEGRGGRALGPLGGDLVKMPAGPAFALLSNSTAPWPAIQGGARNVGGKFKGYVLDKKERPTFRYVLNDVEIEEQPVPVLSARTSLLRKFHLTAAQPPEGLTFLAASGAKIEQIQPGVWSVDQGLTVHVSDGAPTPTLRSDGPLQQLLIPVRFSNGQASFEVEMSW